MRRYDKTMSDEKTIEQIYNEMSPEQQWAIDTIIDDILSEGVTIKHYGVKGMKWGKRKGISGETNQAEGSAGSIEDELDELDEEERELLTQKVNGKVGLIKGLVGSMKIKAARLALNVRLASVQIKLGKRSIFTTVTTNKLGINTNNPSGTTRKYGNRNPNETITTKKTRKKGSIFGETTTTRSSTSKIEMKKPPKYN